MNKKINIFRKLLMFTLAPLIGALLFTACGDDGPTTSIEEPQLNIVETADEAGNFTVLLDLATRVGLNEALVNGELTVFAPTDDAFAEIDSDVLNSLTDEQITAILSYHVLAGAVESGDLAPENTVETDNGDNVFITENGDEVIINGSSNVINPDISASNGVIHVIDEVLFPDTFGTIVDNASKRYELSTLVDIVVQQNLATTLANPEANLTVFAPTNAAFDAISETLSGLSSNQVNETLLYHVLGTIVLSGNLEASQRVATQNEGEEILVEVSDGIVTINNDVQVQVADVEGSNGVIHIIDKVLILAALGGGAPAAVSANITIENEGSSAWLIREIEGDGANATINTANTGLTLNEGLRFTINNLGASNHPFQLRNASGDVLISATGDGSLQNNEDLNVVVNDDAGTITFTLTGNLAANVATYNCQPHAAMEGTVTVN